MKLTKFAHACVRLEKDGKVLLVDPGTFSEDAAFEKADAILVTHEHPDHLDIERVEALDVPVYTNAGVAAQLAELGDRVTWSRTVSRSRRPDSRSRAYGKDHAVILPELGVPCENIGYLIDDAVYHPGDSFTQPDREVHTNLVPISGPWFSLAAGRRLRPRGQGRADVGIHDALLSPIGLGMMARWFLDSDGRPYHGLAPGDTLDIN